MFFLNANFISLFYKNILIIYENIDVFNKCELFLLSLVFTICIPNNPI